MYKRFLNDRVNVKVGNITTERTDAIVNAANSTLLGGGGVDGEIHRVGGKEILRECKKIRKTTFRDGLPTGEAVITTGGNLEAQFVIHTVGPVYGQENGNEADLLATSYRNSLKVAAENNLKTIAFPSISTGAFRYPKHEAAKISSNVIKSFLNKNGQLARITLVFFSIPDLEKFIKHQMF